MEMALPKSGWRAHIINDLRDDLLLRHWMRRGSANPFSEEQ
jgi:hypothetical protein